MLSAANEVMSQVPVDGCACPWSLSPPPSSKCVIPKPTMHHGCACKANLRASKRMVQKPMDDVMEGLGLVQTHRDTTLEELSLRAHFNQKAKFFWDFISVKIRPTRWAWPCHLHKENKQMWGKFECVMRWRLWQGLSVPLNLSLAGPGAPAWGPPPLTSAGPRSPGKLSMWASPGH